MNTSIPEPLPYPSIPENLTRHTAWIVGRILDASASLKFISDGGCDDKWVNKSLELEQDAHAEWRAAGLKDRSTFDLRLICDKYLDS